LPHKRTNLALPLYVANVIIGIVGANPSTWRNRVSAGSFSFGKVGIGM